MAGYSGTPLVRKLGVKDGHCVALINAPAGFEGELEGLPEDVGLRKSLRGAGMIDVAVLFAKDRAALEVGLLPLMERLAADGAIWVAWPKRASGVATDLTEDGVREIVLRTALVDNKVCAINEVWSGLRFVVRLSERGKTGAERMKSGASARARSRGRSGG